MKKALIGILAILAIISVLIGGKIQIDKYRIKSITYGKEGKAAIENILRVLDENALTPEGKIKSYKIDDSYTERNPMGGIEIKLIINDDNKLTVKTALNKYPSRGYIQHGMIVTSEKMTKLVPENEGE